MMGKHYNPGVKLLKAEKAKKELEAKLIELKVTGTKEVQSDEKA